MGCKHTKGPQIHMQAVAWYQRQYRDSVEWSFRQGGMDSVSRMPVDDSPRRVHPCHRYPVSSTVAKFDNMIDADSSARFDVIQIEIIFSKVGNKLAPPIIGPCRPKLHLHWGNA
eukprot:scaffold52488_cov20-Prasinocladus_malaysianus.AAC.1